VTAAEPDKAAGTAVFLAALLGLALFAAAVDGGTYALIPRGETFVLAWWNLALALALGLSPRARPTRASLIALAPWLGLVMWLTASLLWTESRGRTSVELARVLGLGAVLLGISLSFRGREWILAAAAVAVAAFAVCAVAFTSRVAPGLLTNPLAGTEVRRLSFPLNYWNALGCWSSMTVAMGLSWSVHAERRPVRAAALGGVCLASTVAYLSYSRSAAAGVALGAVAVIALSRHRWLAAAHTIVLAAGTAAMIAVIRGEPAIARGTGGEGGGAVALALALAMAGCGAAAYGLSHTHLGELRTPRRRTRAVLIGAAVTATVALVSVGPALADRAWDSFHRPTPAVTGDPALRLTTLGGTRGALWGAAVDGFSRHPLGGTGAGTYEFVWNRDQRRTYFVRDAHSLYFESLVELGLPGALLIVAVLTVLLLAVGRRALRVGDPRGAGAAVGCTAAFLVFCVAAGVDWMWESTAVTALALAAAATVAAAGAGAPVRWRLRRRLVAGGIAMLALAVQLPVLTSALQVRSSQRAWRAGDVDEAISRATTAIQVAPWATGGYLQRALLLERLGMTRGAAVDARRVVARERTNWQNWLILARIEAERRNVRAAVAAVRRAAALNPRAPLFRPARRSRR
jgi:O-Antigen ligase